MRPLLSHVRQGALAAAAANGRTPPPQASAGLALHVAVIASVYAASEKLEQRQRLFANLALAGPGAALRGLPDALERAVRNGLSPDSQVRLVSMQLPQL